MKKLICALIGVAALVASATTYIQTSTTGTAPWRPVKDSVSQAHFADSARKADSSHAATYADSARVSGLADSAKKSGTASNALALGGIAAAQYGTLAQDTLIAKKVASDTATVLRAGIASAITTSEAYGTARISDSLTANTRAWTTLAAAKSSIHDSLTVERTFDSLVARNVTHDTATSLRTYVGSASTTGNAATATKLATARTISMTGDGAWSTSFDGSANATGPLHLARLLASGSAGSASSAPTLTWDTTGRLTSVGSAAISVPHGQISDWGTYINQALLTTSSPTFGQASLGTWGSRPAFAWFGASGQNNVTNGNSGFLQLTGSGHIYMSAPASASAAIQYNGGDYVIVSAAGVSMPNSSGLAVTGLITANGGITGNLTGHASLDIPLTGSSAITGPLVSSSSITANGLITANGGIIGQGNVGSYDQPWNAGYFSTAGIDIGGGLLTFNSPSTSTALLGVTAHPMVIATATGSVAFPAGIGLNGSLGLSVVSVGGTTYSASAHKGRILTIAPSTTFTLPLGSAGDWFIIQSADAQGQGQTAGKINPGGTTIYIRGIAYSSSVAVVGTLIAYCNGVYWYIG